MMDGTVLLFFPTQLVNMTHDWRFGHKRQFAILEISLDHLRSSLIIHPELCPLPPVKGGQAFTVHTEWHHGRRKEIIQRDPALLDGTALQNTAHPVKPGQFAALPVINLPVPDPEIKRPKHGMGAGNHRAVFITGHNG